MTRFTYRDRSTGVWRVGYYHRRTQRLTVLRDTADEIVTHFRCAEDYVRGLPVSDYHRWGDAMGKRAVTTGGTHGKAASCMP